MRERNLVVDGVVGFGVVASLGLIAVSVALNARMGFRSADTDLDGKLYGMGAGLGDCLKAIAPFMFSWAVKNRDVLAGGSACVLFSVCTAYSFTAALGFAAEHRAGREGVAQGAIDARRDLRADKERLESRLSFLGPQRSADEVALAIEAVLAERAWKDGPTVGQVSNGCVLNRKATRDACGRVAGLRAELARAQEAANLTAELGKVSAAMPRGEVVLSADPQVDALGKVAKFVTSALAKEDIGFGLSLLLAVFIELGSGLGLYMVTTPWRIRGGEADKAPEPARKARLGHVDAYVLERVQPVENGRLFLEAAFRDYVEWCGKTGAVPYVAAEFGKRFGVLAKELGIPSYGRGKEAYFVGVGCGTA